MYVTNSGAGAASELTVQDILPEELDQPSIASGSIILTRADGTEVSASDSVTVTTNPATDTLTISLNSGVYLQPGETLGFTMNATAEADADLADLITQNDVISAWWGCAGATSTPVTVMRSFKALPSAISMDVNANNGISGNGSAGEIAICDTNTMYTVIHNSGQTSSLQSQRYVYIVRWPKL